MATSSDLPPYAPARLLAAPFPERVRLVCLSFAAQAHPTPRVVMALYWVKYFVLYIGGWTFFVTWFSTGTDSDVWAFTSDAFHKAILWSICYELLGLGCGMGPMNARFNPPLGGFLHFLRPGTTKLPLFPGAPVVGHYQRGWLDVAAYAVTQLLLLRALVAPEITPAHLWPIVGLIPLLGVTDKTLFLAARAEHYWVALVCLAAAHAGDLWLSACKAVWCAIWFWAATSKINAHFPSVIMVMMTNGPFFPSWLKRRLYTAYPDDLRPSRLAATMAHMGTVTEYSIPFLLVLAAGQPELTAVLLFLMASFHGFIAFNNPSGMPIEWNILMVYGGIFLFGAHSEAPLAALTAMPLLGAFLVCMLVLVPLVGNFVPARVSFLLSMRYYAGNWAYNIWLVRKGSAAKFDKLVKAAGTFRQQLEGLLSDPVAVDTALTLAMAHRFLHFEGRPLLEALPQAVDDIDDYEWMEGEVVGGMVLGWNFGDGHLNGTQLLEAVQAQCGFAPGEVRVVMVESQALFGHTMAWQVVDAATGPLASGVTDLRLMREIQPWPTGKYAEALLRGNTPQS